MKYSREQPAVDADRLRKRYREERAKRLTQDRSEIRGFPSELPGPSLDPYTSHVSRSSRTGSVDVAIIGAGLAGLLVGAHLRMAGVESIQMIDKAGDVGGVWYWNRYPGAQCDVESYIYLPLLEELGYIPTEKYAHQPEILAHCQAIARKYELYRDTLFQTRVTELRWNEATSDWTVSTDRNDRLRARFVCMANGPNARLKAPSIPGIERFRGHSFHTGRWDYDYSGGNSEGGLTGLRDKVVGIIGTGATAVQCVPHLAVASQQLYVFQRTPSSVSPRMNCTTDQSWASSLEPGWQNRRSDNFAALLAGTVERVDLVSDGWTDAFKRIFADPSFEVLQEAERSKASEAADLVLMEEIRNRIDHVVVDKATREALKPYYRFFCKRPCFHDEYLEAFNLPRVVLVDTAGRGVERITERGVVANGSEYQLDCLIYATGFDINAPYTTRSGYDVIGRDGLGLSDKWSAGLSTLYGMMTSGFPNLVFSPGLNSQFATLLVNFTHALVEFSKHVAYVISYCVNKGLDSFDVAKEAEDDWVRKIVCGSSRTSSGSRNSIEYLKSCTPGYLNNEGHPEEFLATNANYGGTPDEFYRLLDAWRLDGKLRGLHFASNQARFGSGRTQ
jgi:cation diffusion facilitator CzcD-associated flavoprotein CzcO